MDAFLVAVAEDHLPVSVERVERRRRRSRPEAGRVRREPVVERWWVMR
jgi:hypothetical protein